MRPRTLSVLVGCGAVFAVAGFVRTNGSVPVPREDAAAVSADVSPRGTEDREPIAARPEPGKPTDPRPEIRACFPDFRGPDSLSALAAELRSRRAFLPPVPIEETHELVTANGEKRVVQYLPGEAEPVRVFSISPVDGLPDRIRDFPGRRAEVRARLAGALSIGRIVAKTTTESRSTAEGAELTLETRAGEVVALRFREDGTDFECSSERCSCAR